MNMRFAISATLLTTTLLLIPINSPVILWSVDQNSRSSICDFATLNNTILDDSYVN